MSSQPSPASARALHVVFAAHDVSDTASSSTPTAASATTGVNSPALQSEGQGVNKPVVRKRAILTALQRASTCLPSLLHFHPVDTPTADLKAALTIHDPLLVALFETGF